MALPKQDRVGARTPANLEQKYGFGAAFSSLDSADKKQGSAFSQYVQLNNATINKMREEQNTFSENTEKSLTEIAEKLNTLEANLSQYWQTVYPVGFIYVSVSSVSPAALFGGTWEQIQDRFLLASGSSYAAGSTGGEASHTLTTGEMPVHDHTPASATVGDHTNCFQTIKNLNSASTARILVDKGSGYYINAADPAASDFTSIDDVNQCAKTAATGGGAAHNNMPPYLAVYVWKRTG